MGLGISSSLGSQSVAFKRRDLRDVFICRFNQSNLGAQLASATSSNYCIEGSSLIRDIFSWISPRFAPSRCGDDCIFIQAI